MRGANSVTEFAPENVAFSVPPKSATDFDTEFVTNSAYGRET